MNKDKIDRQEKRGKVCLQHALWRSTLSRLRVAPIAHPHLSLSPHTQQHRGHIVTFPLTHTADRMKHTRNTNSCDTRAYRAHVVTPKVISRNTHTPSYTPKFTQAHRHAATRAQLHRAHSAPARARLRLILVEIHHHATPHYTTHPLNSHAHAHAQ